jgi:long-chain acyl-CoA synthetase
MTITTVYRDPSFSPSWAPPEPLTLVAAFHAATARVPDRVALRTPSDGIRLTWCQYGRAVERVAGALAGLGVRRGDRVAFLSRNRPELAIAEVAALHLGAAGVALYVASPPATVAYVLRDSAPRVLVVEHALRGVLDQVEHEVQHVVALDGPDALAELPAPRRFCYEDASRAVDPGDLLAIVYTSGTSGLPKGAEWEHGAIVRGLHGFDMPQREPDGTRDVSVVPFAHMGERALGHWRGLLRGSTRTFCADPRELPAALLDARPTFLFGAPQMWRALETRLKATLDQPERAALDRALARVRELAARDAPGPLTSEDELVLGRLRARIGLDRVNRALTASAPCPLSVHEHYHALGIPFGEFYAMTELAPCAMTRPGVVDLGTVGPIVPGYEVELDTDGELLVRSDSRARGYHNLPAETSATFGADGFLRTGDIGVLDQQRRLRIVDRKKELVIPDHGHTIAPSPIEAELKNACPLIGQVIVIGDHRPFLAALIVLEPAERAVDPTALEAVAEAIDHVNAASDPRERIEAYAILPGAWTPGDELTESLKLRRKQTLEKYAADIDAVYAQAASSPDRVLMPIATSKVFRSPLSRPPCRSVSSRPGCD